ncbi:MAG: hypothetical protein AB1347_07505 [Acidobacteriota bacterium]
MKDRGNAWVCLGVLALAAALAGCSLAKDAARTRVENVLSGLSKDDQSIEYQTAICQWFDGTYAMNQGDLEVAMGEFEAWLGQKSLKAPIGAWSVDKVTALPDAAAPTALVEVTVEGRPLTVWVRKDQPMQWR